MSIFKKIRETYFETVNMLQQIRQDKEYFKVFVRTINEECADPKSEFVKMGLKVGDDGESIVYLTGVPEEFQSSGRDYMILDKLNENTYFVTDFLKKIWRGDNYISVPEFYHIEDPASDGVSLMYLAVWHFQPMIPQNLKNKLYAKLGTLGTLVAGSLGYLAFVLI